MMYYVDLDPVSFLIFELFVEVYLILLKINLSLFKEKNQKWLLIKCQQEDRVMVDLKLSFFSLCIFYKWEYFVNM